MTGEQKEAIHMMREQGEGYARIADTVGASVNTVKSFCRRNNLLSRNASDATMNNDATNKDLCKQCGKKLVQSEKGKPRQFCDDDCRFAWWSAHRDQLKRKAMYHLTCACCGAPFDSYGNSGRKYCSHGCYIKHRYLKEARHDRRKHHIAVLQNQANYDLLTVGFSTLFLNRTNVSGILDAGPIGGADQMGKYRLDARFEKNTLVKKIRRINTHATQIEIHCMDAIDLIHNRLLPHGLQDYLINFDPPYVAKGRNLYLNYYRDEDHQLLANAIRQLNCNWITTYDKCEMIHQLYSDFPMYELTFNHSAGKSKTGSEYLILCRELVLGEKSLHSKAFTGRRILE